MEKVIICYMNHTQQEVTEQEARRICSDRTTARRIIDAITDNKQLQTELRQLIDRY